MDMAHGSALRCRGVGEHDGLARGYTPRPDRQAQVNTVLYKLSVMVGGDGLEPTTSSV
jgi:hypothetical protein